MAAKLTPPNYQALLSGDPILQALLRQTSAAGVADQQGLSAARQQALIGYGAIPGVTNSALTGNIAPDITPTTRGLAQAATDSGLSTTAQLRQAYESRAGGDSSSLAARGILHSGAYLQHQDSDLHGYQTGQANAESALLGNLAGLWSGYQGQQGQLAGQVQQGTTDALGRIIAGIGNGTINPAPGATPHGSVAGGLAGPPNVAQTAMQTYARTGPGDNSGRPDITFNPAGPNLPYTTRNPSQATGYPGGQLAVKPRQALPPASQALRAR